MMNKRYTYTLVLMIALSSCYNSVDNAMTIINKKNSSLQLINNDWLFQSQPFTGEIREDYENGSVKSLLKVTDGKLDGASQTFYPNGKTETIRSYKQNEKDGVNSGWWPNGNKRFEYHFTNGTYNGLFTEWYNDGKMVQQIVYENGKDMAGKGWRDDGKLYMNFVVKDGRRYGLMNANLCYSLNSQRIKQ